MFLHGADGVIGFIHNSTNYYYKKNIQGDIIAILNANGQEIAKYTYDAWGNHKIHYLDGTNFVAINSNVCYNSSDPVNKQIATLNPFRYRGYYFDCETGLYYLNSRYYDPEIGRFINADDISVLDLTNVAINGLNLYAYCLNNPVNEIDENGYFVWWIVAAIVAVTVISVGASIIGQAISNNGKINIWQVLFDGLMGALGSLLMITGLGPLGMALWSGALGFVGSIGSELIAGRGFADMDWTGILINTILGLGAGILGGAAINNSRAFGKAFSNSNSLQKALIKVNNVIYKKNNNLYPTIRGYRNAYTKATKNLNKVILSIKYNYAKQTAFWGVGLSLFSKGIYLLHTYSNTKL